MFHTYQRIPGTYVHAFCNSAEVKSKNKTVTLNSESVTEIINKLPDNLNGPVLPCRMISI